MKWSVLYERSHVYNIKRKPPFFLKLMLIRFFVLLYISAWDYLDVCPKDIDLKVELYKMLKFDFGFNVYLK